jgi:hypothetical protein
VVAAVDGFGGACESDGDVMCGSPRGARSIRRSRSNDSTAIRKTAILKKGEAECKLATTRVSAVLYRASTLRGTPRSCLYQTLCTVKSTPPGSSHF